MRGHCCRNPCVILSIPRYCRDFLAKNYKDLKSANPQFPILVREASGIEAKLVARYGACLVGLSGMETALMRHCDWAMWC